MRFAPPSLRQILVVLGLLGGIGAVANAQRAAPGRRQFLSPAELRARNPHTTITGDVRVERGVTISPNARLEQTGTKPLYLLGRSNIEGNATVTQEGDKPLVLLHTNSAGTIRGHGNVVRANNTGAIQLLGGHLLNVANGSTIDGFQGHLRNVSVGGYLGGRVDGAFSDVPGIAVGDPNGGGLVLKRSTIRGIAFAQARASAVLIEGYVVPELTVFGQTPMEQFTAVDANDNNTPYELIRFGKAIQIRAIRRGVTNRSQVYSDMVPMDALSAFRSVLLGIQK